MAKYVLVRGKFTLPSKPGEERQQVKIGETVELSDSQAAAFSDFFKPLEVHLAELKVVEAAARKASGEEKKADTKPEGKQEEKK